MEQELEALQSVWRVKTQWDNEWGVMKNTKFQEVNFDETVEFEGPCVLAFDGEREREIQAGQRVTMRVSRNGPSVLDIPRTMQLAACREWFKN